MRPIKPQYAVNDLEEIDESKFEADSNTEEHEKEPQLLDSYIETSLELNTESEHRQVQFEDNSVRKNCPEGEIGDTWLSKLNENSSSSEEFTVEGQNSTNDQMLTSESITIMLSDDTENYNFRQKSAEPETKQPKYNLRTGDRMIAVREQCAAYLRSLRQSAFDRQTGCINDSGTHIAYWISLDMEPNKKTAKYIFQKHPILKWQPSRQNSCVGQTSLYFDETENRWIISLICSKKSTEPYLPQNIRSCLEDLQFQVQQLRLHEIAIEKIADETRSLMWKDVETVIETTFYHTDLAIIIYDEQTINSIQPEKEPIEDVECGAFFCLKVPAYATGTSVAQSSSFDSMSVHEFLSDTSGSNPQEE